MSKRELHRIEAKLSIVILEPRVFPSTPPSLSNAAGTQLADVVSQRRAIMALVGLACPSSGVR
ncbi:MULTISPECIES: hypothetical protein [Methylobacterium]|uniref:Uncharacterized protein n=1 Tax=Methylobacterium ajmalii TaxID=2738439 RepID=A0ABV0A4M5_9HYPH|nr:hypothetical protein [Methylobacterium aquaticum]